MPTASRITWKGEEEWWAVQPMLLPELFKLLGRSLLAQYGNCGIAWHEFNQQSDKRNHRPHYKQQDCDAAQRAKNLILES